MPSAAPIAFFGTKPTAATPISNCGPNTRKTEREQGRQVDVLVAGMLVNAEGGDNQRQRNAGHQRTTTVRQIRQPAPQQRADQRAHFKQGKALNRHFFRKFQFLECVKR
ncbi:Uncharacterised protein [Citrobacter koseri]|nr:Uncharacterised protein [Citrobacter koseri]